MSHNWYVLSVQPRKECYVQQQLLAHGYQFAYPRYRKSIRHARRTRMVSRPLFPGYMFIRLDLDSDNWRLAHRVPGSIGLVKFANRPSPLPAEFVAKFIHNLDDDGTIQLNPSLKLGDRVQAIGGPFDRCMGEVVNMTDNERVKVLMSALNRKVEMTLPRKTVVVAA